MRCSVENCKFKVRFKFPSAYVRRKKWLNAIQKPDFNPKSSHGLCANHFTKNDIITESYRGGYKLEKVILNREAVPSIFPWNSQNSGHDLKKDSNIIEDEIDTLSDHDDYSDLSIALTVDIEEPIMPSNEHDNLFFPNNHNNGLNISTSNDCKGEKQKLQEDITYNQESTCNKNT